MNTPADPHGATAHDHLVHEAYGPALSGVQAGAALAVGINSLLVLGILPVLLGALADEHRLTASGIGLTAMLEALCMGASTSVMGLIRRPRHIRLIGAGASLALAAINFAAMGAAGPVMMALRAGAGAMEGVVLWITVSMIARTVTPERWAGTYFIGQTLAQLVLALTLAAYIAPRFGANGALAALAATSLLGVAFALFTPNSFAPLPVAPGQSEAPPARGWVALISIAIFVSAGGAVGVYLQPLAQQAGLDAGVARTALSVSLAAQVVGSTLATLLAGRIRYFTVFLVTAAVSLGVWFVFGQKVPAWLFIAANSTWGLVGLFLAPFYTPLTIDADPSRRTAMQNGAAQLVGGSMGPLLASRVVGQGDVHGVLWLGAGLMAAGLMGVAWLRFTHKAAAAG